MSKKQQPKKKNHVILIVVLVIVVLIAGVVIWKKIELYQDKQRFVRLSSQMRDIESQIASTGKAKNFNNIEYCSYNSQKYSRGERSCTVGIEFESNKTEAASDVKKILINEEGWKFRFRDTNGFKDLTMLESYGYNEKDTFCSYSVSKSETLLSSNKIACHLTAKAEYYPVKEN